MARLMLKPKYGLRMRVRIGTDLTRIHNNQNNIRGANVPIIKASAYAWNRYKGCFERYMHMAGNIEYMKLLIYNHIILHHSTSRHRAIAVRLY